MKKLQFILGLLLLCFVPLVYAGGGLTHMFLAQEAIDYLPDTKLRDLLHNNRDAYLTGAYYPDSGYVKGNHYGEDSHWDPFIYAFADYIQATYTDPVTQNPKLVAFLFGCAAHRVSDEIMHRTFYPVIRDKDFHGDGETAHNYGDTGIDLLVNVDKNQWLSQPGTWWVPVKDLVQVYHRMGKDEYTAQEIIWGNTVISMAGYGERLISGPAYPYLQWKMPWTAAHYYDWPTGGIVMDEHKVADYQINLWQRLQGKANLKAKAVTNKGPVHSGSTPVIDFAKKALESGAASVKTRNNPDGSVELQQPGVNEAAKFQALLNELVAKLIK